MGSIGSGPSARLVAALNALVAEPGPETFATARELYETLERALHDTRDRRD